MDTFSMPDFSEAADLVPGLKFELEALASSQAITCYDSLAESIHKAYPSKSAMFTDLVDCVKDASLRLQDLRLKPYQEVSDNDEYGGQLADAYRDLDDCYDSLRTFVLGLESLEIEDAHTEDNYNHTEE